MSLLHSPVQTKTIELGSPQNNFFNIDDFEFSHLTDFQKFIKTISNEIMKLFVEVKKRNNN